MEITKMSLNERTDFFKKQGIETRYVWGFGICFVANEAHELPQDEEGYNICRYYETDEATGWNVYGVDVQGYNKYLPGHVVEYWIVKKD